MIIEASLTIGLCGATRRTKLKIDDKKLEGYTEEEKNEYIDETVNIWANNYIEIDWNVKE